MADEACLKMKALAPPGEWEESYRGVFGVPPSRQLFRAHACEAIGYVTELRVAGRLVGSGEMNKKIGGLLGALTGYRDSIPVYFTSG